MAVTTEKIYNHNAINETWDDESQSGVTYDSVIGSPISFAEVGHDDTNIYLDDDNTKANAYHHIVVCDGGLSNIQRWAGRWEVDFADVLGGGDYHDGTTHRALQVSMSKRNRMILLSPQTYSSSSKLWTNHNQRVRWPTIGKLQVWTGTGSGFVELTDTGGLNVWSAPLGSDHIVYQTIGIWALNYVGGTTVYDPAPVIPDLGLLSYHLLDVYNNVHYFVGTDLNVYAYYGGSLLKAIGDPIHKYLQRDLATDYASRCFLRIGPLGKRLLLFIVEGSGTYITKCYYMDMLTKAWGVRDYSNKFSSSGTGITGITISGSSIYTTGDTYEEALDTLSSYDAADGTTTAGDVTTRYGEHLLDTSRSLSFDPTNASWCDGGQGFDGSVGADYKADFTKNDILMIEDGSTFLRDGTYTNQFGTHFYTIDDVTSAWAQISLIAALTGACVTADVTPANEVTFGLWSPVGDSYNDVLEVIQTAERMILADATGLVYEVDETYTDDDGSLIDSRHLTKEFDMDQPDVYKRWHNLAVVADGTVGGAMQVGYRTTNFETSDTGWEDFTFDLTSEFQEKTFFSNKTSKRIQYRFTDFSGKSFNVREYKLKYSNPLGVRNG